MNLTLVAARDTGSRLYPTAVEKASPPSIASLAFFEASILTKLFSFSTRETVTSAAAVLIIVDASSPAFAEVPASPAVVAHQYRIALASQLRRDGRERCRIGTDSKQYCHHTDCDGR